MVTSALELMDKDNTQQTRLFIRMVNKFFDCLNLKCPLLGQIKNKESVAPYTCTTPTDHRFKVGRACASSYIKDFVVIYLCTPISVAS